MNFTQTNALSPFLYDWRQKIHFTQLRTYLHRAVCYCFYTDAQSHVNAIKIINWTKLWKTEFSVMLFI